MRDINNFCGDVGQQELTACNLAALQVAARYANLLSPELASADRDGLTSFLLHVEEMSRLAGELLRCDQIEPDDANICYTVRMAVRMIAKRQHKDYHMKSIRTDDGYMLSLTLK